MKNIIIKIILTAVIITIAATLLACGAKVTSKDKTTVSGESARSLKEPAANVGEPWRIEWDKTLENARKEGKVVVYGPAIAETRLGFIDGFQRAYPGITLEYTGLTGALSAPKIKSERQAGIFMVDFYIGGTTSALLNLREYAIPIKPLLILPEIRDPKIWLNGKMDFADDAEVLNLVFSTYVNSPVAYNAELVDSKKFENASYWDLTKSEWREKIIYWDPRISGSGLAMATFWYTTPGLGVSYLKALAANKVVLSRDMRLAAEQVARGKYSMVLSPHVASVFELQKAGAPLKWTGDFKEGTYITSGLGSILALDKAPHPNAARVFLNWLLGKEGQTIWSKTAETPSRRLDVPADHLISEMIPKIGITYQPNYKEPYIMMKDEIGEQIHQIFVGF